MFTERDGGGGWDAEGAGLGHMRDSCMDSLSIYSCIYLEINVQLFIKIMFMYILVRHDNKECLFNYLIEFDCYF